MKELAADIHKRGLDSPILVQPYVKGDFEYRVVAGHRRFEAFKLNKADTIPAFVREDIKSEFDARQLNLIENLNRKDLNILQEANALRYFLTYKTGNGKHCFTDKDLATIFGQSTGWITTRKQLLTLPKDIQAEAATGLLKQNHIKELAKLEIIDQYELVKRIKEAVAKGEKVTLVKTDNADLMKARARDRGEIKTMYRMIYDVLGPSITTRLGAWCAGEISTVTFMTDLEKYCKEESITFQLPENVKNAIYGIETVVPVNPLPKVD